MKANRKNKFSFKNWCEDNKLYFLAFILPVLSMLVVYFFKGIYPFGDGMYLRSDCYHQYTPYLEILQNKLHEGGSLFYTWQIGAGMNFMAIAAYYLSSPFNLLTIFWPGNMADIVSFFILLKMGLAGFSATYYLTKKFHMNNASTVAFGMFYALSAYFAAFSWNIMWLDCMWLLPFIILGLERLVTQRNYKMYCIALALSIFSNYYIGIMLCIYSVMYFIYLLCVTDFKQDADKSIQRLLALKDFVIYSLLAGGLASIVILPEYFNLLITKSADTSFPEAIEEYFSILYMLFRSLICIPVADLKYPHDPNIYCSVAVFILIPLFWLCKKIDIREKIGKTVIAVIMLLSFNLNILNYIWHGFHFPNSLPCRESFIYIFLIVTMGYEAFIYIREYKTTQIIGCAGISAGLILLLQELFKKADFFDNLEITTDIVKIIYFSLLFILLYVTLILSYRKKPEMKGFMTYLLILIVFCEMTLNMNVTGIASSSSRTSYYESVNAYEELNSEAEKIAQSDNMGFYRTEEQNHSTRNDGARFGYNSMSTFCSVSSAAMQDYYDQIGLQTSFNAYSYYGHTPLTAALFSVKYEYALSQPSLPDNMTRIKSTNYGSGDGFYNSGTPLVLYEYNETLPLGFMINASTEANWKKDSGNPFTTQNNFVTTAVKGGKYIFHRLHSDFAGTFTAQYEPEAQDTDIQNNNPTSYDVYFFCKTNAENLTATISGGTIIDEEASSTTKTFSSTNQNYICHVGNVPAGATITISASGNETISECYAYAFDKDAWQADYALLSANPYQVDSFSDTKITGKITADKQGIMYTSIPYDKGWSVYIDGEKVKSTAICSGALTGVMVDAGTHEITFKYMPQGFIAGLCLTIICLLIFLAIIFKENLKNLIGSKKTKKK